MNLDYAVSKNHKVNELKRRLEYVKLISNNIENTLNMILELELAGYTDVVDVDKLEDWANEKLFGKQK